LRLRLGVLALNSLGLRLAALRLLRLFAAIPSVLGVV
jgi:hypothetical protein